MTDASATRNGRRLQIGNILLGIVGIVAYAVSMFTSGAVSVVITAFGLLGFLMTLGPLIRRLRHFGLIVKTTAISPEAAQALAASNVEALDLTTPDGARLRGWLVKNSTEPRAPLLMYFEGSGADSATMIPFLNTRDGWSVAVINFRGFG